MLLWTDFPSLRSQFSDDKEEKSSSTGVPHRLRPKRAHNSKNQATCTSARGWTIIMQNGRNGSRTAVDEYMDPSIEDHVYPIETEYKRISTSPTAFKREMTPRPQKRPSIYCGSFDRSRTTDVDSTRCCQEIVTDPMTKVVQQGTKRAWKFA
jgi:hypothetical protein